MIFSLVLSAPLLAGAFAFSPAALRPGTSSSPHAALVPAGSLGIRRIPAQLEARAAAVSPLGLFGLFGSDASDSDDDELARFSALASTDRKFDGLSEYIREWGQLFEGYRDMGLTTPVKVFPSERGASSSSSSSSEDKEDVVRATGVRIVFQPTKTGDAYKSRDEEREQEKARGEGEPSEEKKPKKEGGVEVLVEQLADGEVRVRATRCDIDEGTMVKEMSEEVIVKELKRAVDVWRKEHG